MAPKATVGTGAVIPVSCSARAASTSKGKLSVVRDDILAGGPLSMLTYCGLADPAYRNSSIVTTARKALVRQMREMMLGVWRESHHVCENYSPWKQETAACT